jgi:hypothetical protein
VNGDRFAQGMRGVGRRGARLTTRELDLNELHHRHHHRADEAREETRPTAPVTMPIQ